MKKRNITIKLGYANCKIFKCNSCLSPECFKSSSSSVKSLKCEDCDEEMELINHISFVDVPGHNLYMSTMLNGTSVMDYSIIVESVTNTEIPAPQTKEHLMASKIANIENLLVCLNKLDLVKKEEAVKFITTLETQLINTPAESKPIIPVSATFNSNIDILLEYLSQIKPKNKINYDDKFCNMMVLRSFNSNKPGIKINDIKGGIVGGSIIEGRLKVGDNITVIPGYLNKNQSKPDDDDPKRFKFTPLTCKVLSINSETNSLDYAITGGLIGVQLDIDPAFSADDGIVGNILVKGDKDYINNFEVYEDIRVEIELYDKTSKPEAGDKILLNINSTNTKGEIIRYKNSKMGIALERPICVNINSDKLVTITKINENSHLHIVGRGKIIEGNKSILEII